MNLKERAASPGISYAMARRWRNAGTLSAAACQAGRLIVTGTRPRQSERALPQCTPACPAVAGKAARAAG